MYIISNEAMALASATAFFAYLLPFLIDLPEPMDQGCKGDYQINKGYIDGKYLTYPADEVAMDFPHDCHEICREDDTCEAWAWTNGTLTGECSLHKSIGPNSIEYKYGSIIGTRNSCKLECFGLIGDQKAVENMQICNNTDCTSIIYKEPSEIEPEDEIVMCFKEEDEYRCGDLDYEDTGYCCSAALQQCSPSQPGTTTSLVDDHLNDGHHRGHLRYWNGYPMPWGGSGYYYG